MAASLLPPRTVRVLIIDDEPSVGRALARILRGELEVLTADSPEEGLDAARRFRPDVVLCDYHMPGMDGIEVLARIAGCAPEARRYLLTGSIDLVAPPDGCHGVLTKPCDLELLRSTIRSAGADTPIATDSPPAP